MGERVTVIDIARAAGVSKSTVSLVLQGSPLVNEGTRARVNAAIRELGYVYENAVGFDLEKRQVGIEILHKKVNVDLSRLAAPGLSNIVTGDKVQGGQDLGVGVFDVCRFNLDLQPILQQLLGMNQRVTNAGRKIKIPVRSRLDRCRPRLGVTCAKK